MSYRGEPVTIVETSRLANPVNLVTDISVAANNVDDLTTLNKRLDTLKRKTPDVEETSTRQYFQY